MDRRRHAPQSRVALYVARLRGAGAGDDLQRRHDGGAPHYWRRLLALRRIRRCLGQPPQAGRRLVARRPAARHLRSRALPALAALPGLVPRRLPGIADRLYAARRDAQTSEMRRTYDILIALVAAYIFITFPLYTGPAALAEYRAAFVTPLMFSLYL